MHDTIYVEAFANKGVWPDSTFRDAAIVEVEDKENSKNAKATSRVLEMIVDIY